MVQKDTHTYTHAHTQCVFVSGVINIMSVAYRSMLIAMRVKTDALMLSTEMNWFSLQ